MKTTKTTTAVAEAQDAPTLTPRSPMEIAHSLMAQGKQIDPNVIEKFLAMEERYQARIAEDAFNAAMAQCQAEMPRVWKTSHNSHTKSGYADLEQVQETLRPIYQKHGFSISYSADAAKSNADTLCIVADVMHTAGHTKRFELPLTIDGKGAKGGGVMNGPQGGGSTVSYGRRYLLLMIFNVTLTGEDNDAQGAPLTSAQIVEINTLIDECGKAGNQVDLDKLLKWLRVESLDQAPASAYAKIVTMLNTKRRQKKEQSQ